MTLGDRLIEMLGAGYDIHFYWEFNQSGNQKYDNLIINVSKGDKWETHRFTRDEFRLLVLPDSALEVTLERFEEEIDSLEPDCIQANEWLEDEEEE